MNLKRPCWYALAAATITPLALHAQALPPSLFLPEMLLPRTVIKASAEPVVLAAARAPKDITQVTYTFNGRTRTFGQFRDEAKVKSFMVLKDGQIVHEFHRFPNSRTTLHQSWSISKQVLSTMVGIALQDGAIKSIDDRMDLYEPRLSANGFAGVTFKQALQMSSGVKYSEESDRYSLFFDVFRNRYSFGNSGSSLTEKTLSPSLAPAFPPGSSYQYVSINSEAIRMALEKAVGMRYQDYLSTRLWQPMGIPDAAKNLTDRDQTAFTFCCLYATTTAYAMIGQMYAQGGAFNGRQIVSRDYVRQATTFAGDPSNWRAASVPRKDGSALRGFGYHWWPLEGEREDFIASGVFGQSIHVLPKQNTVIVRISSDHQNVEGSSYEAAILGRAIADHLQ